MRILYFSFVELDMPNACQTHTLGVLSGLSEHGCQVDAVVPRSINVRPKIPGVRFAYLWPWGFSGVGRACFKIFGFLVMLFLCIRNKFNAIYIREMEQNPGPRICSKLFNIPLYIEINDLIVPAVSENEVRSSYVQKVKKHQELDFNQSSGLIIPSVPMCNWIVDEYGLSKNKVHIIINGSNLTKAKRVTSHQARRKLGLPPNSFCLGFVGNVYERYDFKTILRAIVECQNQIPALYFVIVGEGPLISEVRDMVDDLCLKERTIFTGYIQPDKLSEILPAIHIGLLCLTKKNALRYGPVTTKLSTYALHNLAVITAGESLKGYPIGLAQGLFLVPPENPHVLADLFIYLYKHPEKRKQKAEILNDFARKKLTWKQVTADILKVFADQVKTL
jgi:glycosyltransferase involved in cell wall biosynthesis